MKKSSTLFKIASIGFLIAIILTIPSCKKLTNLTEGTKLIIDYNLIKTSFTIKFYDAATGILIGEGEDNRFVDVTIFGQNADNVLDITGTQPITFHSAEGFLALAINPDVTPSLSNPAKFTIVTHLDGYLPNSKAITVYKEGNYIYDIYLVDINNPPNGVSRISNHSGHSNNEGVVEEDIIVTTPNGMATVTIYAGTILKEGNGNPCTGTITVNLAHFSNLEYESLLAFPGGLETTVNMPDGSVDEGLFFSAGFISLDVFDENWSTADSAYIHAVNMQMFVPEETYNSSTLGGVADGDILPLWSYNLNEGTWNFESNDTINATDKGLFEVISNTWHFSYWNWDWFWGEYCPEGLEINFHSEDYTCDCYWLKATITNPYNGAYMMSSWFYACNNEPVRLLYVPAFFPVNITFTGYCNGLYTELDYYYIDNLCAANILDITLYSETIGSNVLFEISGYCPNNPNFEVRPTLGVWFRPANNWCWQYAFMYNGYADICNVILGEPYVFGVVYDGHWTEYTVTPDYDAYIYQELELTDDICTNVLGL